MSKSYVIQWKSKVNGRAGRGTRQMARDEAERLAAELNREYPDIEHEPVLAQTATVPSGGASGADLSDESAEHAAEASTTRHAHSFSSR